MKNCSTCRKCLNQRREPLIPTALPELPWQRVGTEFRGHSYLLVVDYYSRFIEIARLNRTTSEEGASGSGCQKVWAWLSMARPAVASLEPAFDHTPD